jgi:glucose/arabinose dehydrogenase/mono/diheme cytochrome c family protein
MVAFCSRCAWLVFLLGLGTRFIAPAAADDPTSGALDASARPMQYECRWTAQPPVIDGATDEPQWQRAQVISDFYLPWLGTPLKKSHTATRARLLWDHDYLYFCAELEDHDLCAKIQDHDGPLWHDDVFELFFKPAGDKHGYYEFEVNPANAVLDMFLPARDAGGYDKFARANPFHVETAVKLRGKLNQHDGHDQGWTVEGRIPWRDFLPTGGRPSPSERWKFALCRYDYSQAEAEPELSTCTRLSKADFHTYEDYAELKFMGPATAPGPIPLVDWRPCTTSKVIGSPEPPPPYRAVRTLPQLSPDFPIFAATVPGSHRLIVIDEREPYGPARLLCTADPPASGKLEKLTDFGNGIAYSAAFHPHFAENRFLYVGWNDGKQTRVTRYTLSHSEPLQIVEHSALTIIEWDSNGHNGGAVAFGNDGMLYVTSGDGTSDSDANLVGQRLDHLESKVLRIDVDHPDQGRAYSIPSDNPFVGRQEARPETWAYGLRNPWRITVDAHSGAVWVGNNGQDLWEQAYRIERGANYGWSVVEGSHEFYANRQAGPTPISKPTFEHPHSEFRSLTGGVVYYGRRFPDLQGCYIYGDYSTGKLWAGKLSENRITRHEELASTGLAITCIAIDADGELLIANHRNQGEGGFYTLERNPAPQDANAFPRRLSETGLFQKVASHELQPSALPYSVNAPLWSDGAYKERALFLPATAQAGAQGQAPRIEYTHTGGWKFPDHTVIVKSFALDSSTGAQTRRQWVETRLLVKEQNEWVGYSYAWNEAQTDATLVAKEGLDRNYLVGAGTKRRQQTWHYPSRTECMVCHSRAANYVLGLSELQMNKLHDYQGTRANQLAVFETLGLFRIDLAADIRRELRGELSAKGISHDDLDKQTEALLPAKDQRQITSGSLFLHPPDKLPHLVDPYDAKLDLNLRARSYLHANCAQCHVKEGGGNAKFSVDFLLDLGETKLIDARPQHHTFDLTDARLVAPGAPERSVLLHRMALRGAGQMPQLGTNVVDQPAVALLREWILKLKP